MTASTQDPRAAVLVLDGWAGISRQPVDVIGETPTRYRIQARQRTKLAGRSRWMEVGETAFGPKVRREISTPVRRLAK